MHLDELPSEVLYQISESLPSRDVLRSLSLVSKRLNYLFSNILYWKHRSCSKSFGNNVSVVEEIRSSEDINTKLEECNQVYKYPPTKTKMIDWKKSCIERETLSSLWPEARKNFFHYKHRQDSSIDGGKTCVTGSRDRSIQIYDVTKMRNDMEEEAALQHRAIDIHKGWIWTISFENDIRFCSGGWDSWLKIWDIENNCKLQEVQSIKCESAILCSQYVSPGLIAVGMYHKTVKLLDPRTFPTQTSQSTKIPSCNSRAATIPLTVPLQSCRNNLLPSSCSSNLSNFDPYSAIPYHVPPSKPFTRNDRSLEYHQEEPETVTINGIKDVLITNEPSAPFPALYSNDKKLHSGPILCLALDKDRNILITGSEDKTLHISDLRFLKQTSTNIFDDEKRDDIFLGRDIYTSLEESRKSPIKSLLKIPLNGIPLTMSYDSNCLWVGDDQANIYLFDPSDNFNLIGKFYSGHAYSIRNIKHTSPGCGLLFTCSADKSFKVFEPTWPPKLVYSQKMCLESEMASLDYMNGILAVASADGEVNIWKPY